MKKLLLTLLLVLAFSSTHAEYQRFLDNNPNWPLIYGHMDSASYLDASSVVVKYYDNKGIVIAVNVMFGVNKNTTKYERLATKWIYVFNPSIKSWYRSVNIDNRIITLPPSAYPQSAYLSHDNGETWKLIDLTNTSGYNLGAKLMIEEAVEALINKK